MAEYQHISQHRRNSVMLSVSLSKAALKGDWKTAEALLLEDASMFTASLTLNGETVLHVASLAGHADFVRKLVQMMSEEEMLTTNNQGYTALCFIARQGSVRIARLLLEKASAMARVSSGGCPDARGTPLYHASAVGNREMAELLFPESGFDDWTDAEKVDFLTTAIESRLWFLATRVLEKDTSLAIVENSKNSTPLRALADNPIVSGCCTHSSSDIQRLCRLMVDGILPQRDVDGQTTTRRQAGLETVRCVISKAAKSGNVELLVELFHRFPGLVYEDVEVGQGVLRAAVSNRHERIYNLLYEVLGMKEMVTSYIDSSGNNLLHLAANLGPSDKLNDLPTDLQIQSELAWFKEVEKIVPHQYRNMTNRAGQTPKELFISQHKSLVKEGEKAAKHFLVVAMLVAVLTSIFDVPVLREEWSVLFSVLRIVTIASSWVSMLTFLSVLTSYCIAINLAFLPAFLPMQLVVGMVLSCVSVLSLLISFFVSMELCDESVFLKILLCVPAIVPVLFAMDGLLDTKIRYRSSFRPRFRSGYRVIS